MQFIFQKIKTGATHSESSSRACLRGPNARTTSLADSLRCAWHPAPQRKTTRARGYSLMEVMFAIAVLAVGLIAIASLFPVGLIQQKRAIDDAQGVIIGNNVLASIRASRYTAGDFPVTATFQPITTITTSPIDGDKVKRIVVLDGGTNYSSAPTVTLLGGGWTAQAVAEATLVPLGGRVDSISTTPPPGTRTPGAGYTTAPSVQISGGGGTGARAKAYLGSPSDFIDSTGTYDYALAYRHPTGGAVEVAVFVYRTASVTAGQSASQVIVEAPHAIGAAPLTGSQQVSFAPFASPNGRNQFILACDSAAPFNAYVLNVVSGNSAGPPVVNGTVALGPSTATNRTLYLPQKALAIVTGVVR